MIILGVGCLSDASACILKDGKIIAAVNQERLNRIKLWHGVPWLAMDEVLRTVGLQMKDVDFIATHCLLEPERDWTCFEDTRKRILAGNMSPEDKKRQLDLLDIRETRERKVIGERHPNFIEELEKADRPIRKYGHHLCHVASAFYATSWKECSIITLDGWGEDGNSGIIAHGEGDRIVVDVEIPSIDSWGYFYGSIAKSLGFIPHRHEGKILGLAAYCETPESYISIRQMMDYDKKTKKFRGLMENGMYVPSYDNLKLVEFCRNYSREDIAAAAQKTLEEVVCEAVLDLGRDNLKLSLAGGVFANVKLNQRLLELPNVEEIFVFPNMGDGGLSAGAAYLCYWEIAGKRPNGLENAYLGSEFADEDIEQALNVAGLYFERCDNINEVVADLLANEQIVARFSGRMEYGPRALGNRSILYHAKDATVNRWLNEQLNRSEFMPFAPATLAEYAEQCYLNIGKARRSAEFMTATFSCTELMKQQAPAAIHVDGTARPQLVRADRNPDFHDILTRYHEKTGICSVINTSFNMHEEPIVCSPSDAIRAFQLGHLPYLAIGSYLVRRQDAMR